MCRLILLFLLPVSVSAQLKRFQFTEEKMGSPFTIIFYCSDSGRATELSQHCFALVDSLNYIFSDYSPTSEISLLSKSASTKEQPVSDELFKMIIRSRVAWKDSEKTFDITTGALTQLWRISKSKNVFPSAEEINAAKKLTGFKNIEINNKTKTITIKTPGLSFDFGGIVKGYAAQKVVDYLKNENINSALADAGGDIAMSDSPPEKRGWIVGINMPESENELWSKKLELENGAVATSGDVYRYTIHNGIKYSHIIDPRTGYGVTSQRNVTVIAKDGATADWLATACSILPIKKVLKLVKKEKAGLFITTLENKKIVIYKTRNFENYFHKDEQ